MKPFLLLSLLVLSLQAFAQVDTVTSDGLFQAARNEAFSRSNYPLAKYYCWKALEKSPGYSDIRIFLGRMYTWDKKLDSARACFDYVLKEDPGNEDASSAYTDLEYWNDNNAAALQRANGGLAYHPTSSELLLRKAKVLSAMKQYSEAGLITDTLLRMDRRNAAARSLANQIKDDRSLSRIGVYYDYVYFDKQFPDPWQLASMDYGYRTGIGTVIGRVNYARRFGDNGIQFEVDAYPRISKIFYLYVNAGYSNQMGVFPKWRGGLSVFANLPKSFEAELGMRYLYFSSATSIYTAYIGKYYSSFLFGARTYLVPSKYTALSQSYNIFSRYYFGGADDYIGLNLGTGFSPEERYLNPQLFDASVKLKAYKGSVDFRHAIKRNIFLASFSLIRQELLQGYWGTQIQPGIGYIRRF